MCIHGHSQIQQKNLKNKNKNQAEQEQFWFHQPNSECINALTKIHKQHFIASAIMRRGADVCTTHHIVPISICMHCHNRKKFLMNANSTGICIRNIMARFKSICIHKLGTKWCAAHRRQRILSTKIQYTLLFSFNDIQELCVIILKLIPFKQISMCSSFILGTQFEYAKSTKRLSHNVNSF